MVEPVSCGDADRIAILLGQLGCPTDADEVRTRLEFWADEPYGAVLGGYTTESSPDWPPCTGWPSWLIGR